MTPQQQTAIKYHCRLAGETIHPRFRRVNELISIIMTVDSGYE